MSAAKRGAKAVGFELDSALLNLSERNARKAGVTLGTEFRQQDIFTVDLSEATVVTRYLLPELNLKLRPKLLSKLQPGTKIVSHDFDMGDWKPEETVKAGAEFESLTRRLVDNNSRDNRPEGWPEVLTREQLATAPILGGHDIVLEEFLASAPRQPAIS